MSSTRNIRILAYCLAPILFWDCASGATSLPLTDRAGFSRIVFPGVGPLGIFDASIAAAPGSNRVWMSYSSVEPSYRWSSDHPHTVSTRLAFSDDRGASWIDANLWINRSEDVTEAVAGEQCGAKPCTWNFEVSRLVYDEGAVPTERWKLFYHRYLMVNGDRDFRIGWIAMKQAADPVALARSPEVVLLAGSLFKQAGASPLVSTQECLALSEPGAIARGQDLFLALFCAKGRHMSSGSILLYQLHHPDGRWTLAGTLLDNREDSARLRARGIPAEGFSAPELFSFRGRTILAVTPTKDNFPEYRGCYLFEVQDLPAARILSDERGPRPLRTLAGASHNGACAYAEEAPASGLILSELQPDATAVFRLYRTGIHP